MTRKALTVVCLTFVLPIWASAQNTTDVVQLRWQFAVGQTYKVEMEQNVAQEVTMHGTPAESRTDTTTWMTWFVNKVDDAGSASMTCTIDRIKMELDIPLVGLVTVDTTQLDEAEALAASFGNMLTHMIGKKMKQTMSPQGELSNVVIPEEMFEGVETGPGLSYAMNAQQMAEMIKKASPVFPDEAMQVGKKWSQSTTTETPAGNRQLESEFEYLGATTVDGKAVHQVDLDSKLSFPQGPNALGATITISDQDIGGSFYFDAENGQLFKSVIDQEMTMTIAIGPQQLVQRTVQVAKVSFTLE